MTAPLRVLIADDHPLFRDGVRALVASVPELELVGEASDGDQAIARAAQTRPDVILMDLKMPGTNGIEATRRIVQAHPHIGVLVVTMFEDDASVFAAMRAGARGYLLKGADQEEILRAVHAVGQGEAIFGPTIARRLTQFFAAAQTGQPPPAFPDLTERERAVLHLIAAGQSNPAIARRLGVTPKTVRNYVSLIFSKLQVADRAQAIVRARDAGLGGEAAPPGAR